MIAENLFVANVDKDLLWMGYLLSFEDETIRQDHNCNACKSFIRHYGKVVAIDPQTYKVKTFWDDVHTPGYEKTAQDGCKNPDPVRGFFNEYLRADLEKEHRRVFEALGSRAKAEYSDDQLSGLGFSSTSHNDVVVKVDNKSFKIIF